MPRVSSRRQVIQTLKRLANQDNSFSSRSRVLPARRKVFSTPNSGLSHFGLILQLPQIQAVFNLEPHVCVALWMIFQRRPKCLLKSSTTQAGQHPLAPFNDPALWASRNDTFFTLARMNRSSFLTLLNQLATCDLFENQSTCPQAPIKLQLIVTLANLGLSGNGGGLEVLAHLFGISSELLPIITLEEIND
ncbi:hypothetical protein DFH28DRAFT_1122856 [Melampsora americana]|nr:hypothetical protein DFH28DRAFT_1122856 [Melampsora americana]